MKKTTGILIATSLATLIFGSLYANAVDSAVTFWEAFVRGFQFDASVFFDIGDDTDSIKRWHFLYTVSLWATIILAAFNVYRWWTQRQQEATCAISEQSTASRPTEQ